MGNTHTFTRHAVQNALRCLLKRPCAPFLRGFWGLEVWGWRARLPFSTVQRAIFPTGVSFGTHDRTYNSPFPPQQCTLGANLSCPEVTAVTPGIVTRSCLHAVASVCLLHYASNKYVFIPAVPYCVCQVHSEIFAQVALFGNGSDRCWTFSPATKRQGRFSCRLADPSSCFYC